MSADEDENVENDDDLVHDEKPEVKTFYFVNPYYEISLYIVGDVD